MFFQYFLNFTRWEYFAIGSSQIYSFTVAMSLTTDMFTGPKNMSLFTLCAVTLKDLVDDLWMTFIS